MPLGVSKQLAGGGATHGRRRNYSADDVTLRIARLEEIINKKTKTEAVDKSLYEGSRYNLFVLQNASQYCIA